MAISLTRTKGERRPKHRAVDEVERLRVANDELVCKVVQLTTENAQVTAQLDKTGIELSGARLDNEHAADTVQHLTGQLAAARREIERLGHELAPYLAADANARAVTVPSWVRDTSAEEDRATAPLDVAELRDTHNTTATAWRAPTDTRVIPLQQRGDEHEKGAA